MFPTAEVRWFYQGTIPPGIWEWFQRSAHSLEEQPQRVDCYLRHVGIDSLGIKLREGRLEIKQRQRQSGLVRFHERIVGQVEHWQKWSFELAEAEGELASASALTSFWVPVEKRRTLCTYGVLGDQVVAIQQGAACSRGCGLELTSIRVGKSKWWSVGLEAFGEETALEDALLLVARHLLTRGKGPILAAEASYSYPRWLALVDLE